MAALLWTPVAEADPTRADIEPSFQLLLVNQFVVNLDAESRFPLLEHRSCSQDAAALDDDTRCELRILAQFIPRNSLAFAVVLELSIAKNDQPLPHLRALLELAG